MNLIIYSKEEGYEEGVELLKRNAAQSNKPCRAVDIKDFQRLLKSKEFIRASFYLYFLTSDHRIPRFIKFLKGNNKIIINKAFLSDNISTSKFDSITKIRLNGITVPESCSLAVAAQSDINNFSPPAFLKPKSSRGLIRRINTKKSLIAAVRSIPESKRAGYFLEKDVLEKGSSELKIYYINGKVFVADGNQLNNIPDWIKKVLRKISGILKLEVFSADFIVDWTRRLYYCFDINHASSFFQSMPARMEFINKIFQ